MTVLCYHAIERGWSTPLATDPDTFARHCAWLARHRRVVPLSQLVPEGDSDWRPDRGTAALTFDDGFAGLHEHALPTLLRHRLPATVFLVAQTLTPEGRSVDWVDRPPSQRMDTLGLDQVLEMQRAGVSFESHSWAHADLTTLSYAECVRDLRDSRELLEDLLRRPVRMLAYPRGRHSPAVRRAAREAGYDCAFSLPEGPEPVGRFAVPRVGIYRGNGTAAMRIKCAHPYLRLRTSELHPVMRRLGRRAPAVAPGSR